MCSFSLQEDRPPSGLSPSPPVHRPRPASEEWTAVLENDNLKEGTCKKLFIYEVFSGLLRLSYRERPGPLPAPSLSAGQHAHSMWIIPVPYLLYLCSW